LIKNICLEIDPHIELSSVCSAEAFIGAKNNLLLENIKDAIIDVTNLTPKLSTTGGTSDARFIKSYCPVVEFGLINKTAHQIDEHVDLDDILNLERIYYSFLQKFFEIS
jgi:succinyl-diaminopimelate desuccinylase